MSWTYLQTIPTIATSYFEEKTEVSFRQEQELKYLIFMEKKKSVAVSSFNFQVGTDQAASNDKKFC